MTTSAWELVWSDEFDGPAGTLPDTTRWKYSLGGSGWGNQEWQYYTDLHVNIHLDGEGALVITAEAVQTPQAGRLKCWYGPCRYTSARISTKGCFEFTFGRVEGRIKIPFGQGIWSAFWMLGANIADVDWPACGEIDIMENIGHEPFTVYGTVHGPGYSGENGLSNAFTHPSRQAFTDDFHIFSLEWEPNILRWYVDDHRYATLKSDQLPVGSPWVYTHPFYIVLNLAVGGKWPGYPDQTTLFPQRMWVDYVRVYQHL